MINSFPGRKKRMDISGRRSEYPKYPENDRKPVSVLKRENGMNRCVLQKFLGSCSENGLEL